MLITPAFGVCFGVVADGIGGRDGGCGRVGGVFGRIGGTFGIPRLL